MANGHGRHANRCARDGENSGAFLKDHTRTPEEADKLMRPTKRLIADAARNSEGDDNFAYRLAGGDDQSTADPVCTRQLLDRLWCAAQPIELVFLYTKAENHFQIPVSRTRGTVRAIFWSIECLFITRRSTATT